MDPFCLVVAAGSSQLGPETLVDRAQPLNEDIDLVSRYRFEVLLVFYKNWAQCIFNDWPGDGREGGGAIVVGYTREKQLKH